MRREFVLIEHNARFYSPSTGRFIQPDSVIPSLTNSQSWNRYSYVNNSPIMYVDPSGHYMEQACGFGGGDCGTGEGVPDAPDSGPDGGGDQPGDIDDDVETQNDDSSKVQSYGACESARGFEECESWNEMFDPWIFYPNWEKAYMLDIIAEVYGMEKLLMEGSECHTSGHISSQCINQFWSLEDQTAIPDNYLGHQINMSQKFGNPLMDFLLDEVGASSYNFANRDPAWIHAIYVTADSHTIQKAKDKAFNNYYEKYLQYEDKFEMDEFLKFIFGTRPKGGE